MPRASRTGSPRTLCTDGWTGSTGWSWDRSKLIEQVGADAREAISSGFWFGDERSYPEPAFYSYTAPEPDEMQRQPLGSGGRAVDDSNGSHLALLPYDDVRTAPDAPAEILQFYDTAYAVGARLAGWNTDRLCPGGVTDPQALVTAHPRPRT
ncbi:DUF5996 family protein [Streptomyces anulatus]|uniref:DUF5996 family protein n=1 Tax=Streptomyces anulatus TaxID=1892 RepID=UPI003669C75D